MNLSKFFQQIAPAFPHFITARQRKLVMLIACALAVCTTLCSTPSRCVCAVGMHKRHTQVSNACFCRHRRRRRRRLTHANLLLRAARSFHARDVHSARAVSAAQSSVAAASDANTARFKLYQTWVTRRTLHSATTLDQNNKKNQEQVN